MTCGTKLAQKVVLVAVLQAAGVKDRNKLELLQNLLKMMQAIGAMQHLELGMKRMGMSLTKVHRRIRMNLLVEGRIMPLVAIKVVGTNQRLLALMAVLLGIIGIIKMLVHHWEKRKTLQRILIVGVV